MDDLIERLRAVKWEVTDDCGRMPDDPMHKCVFVDMRPDDFRALLREAAAALEAAREDAARYRWLRQRWGRVTETYDGDSGRIVEIGTEPEGDGWDVEPETLDAAVDAAMAKDGER